VPFRGNGPRAADVRENLLGLLLALVRVLEIWQIAILLFSFRFPPLARACGGWVHRGARSPAAISAIAVSLLNCARQKGGDGDS
jgi:hypothetical protein